MFEVGFSKVTTYRQCPKRYDYAYVQNLQAKRKPVALFRGTILHEMLQQLDGKGDEIGRTREVLKGYEVKYADLLDAEQEYYGEHFIDDIRRIFGGYLREYHDTDNWRVESVEEEVCTSLAKGIRFVGHIDKRVRTPKDKRRWLVDYKTKKIIPDAEERFNNYQLLLYVWAWNREHPDEEVDGIIWDYLRTKAPTIPEPLKKGGLTQRADLDSDVYTYEAAIKRHKLDPDDYADYLDALEKRSRNKFYERVSLPNPPEEMVETVVEEFRQTAIIIQELTVYPRNMTFMCPKQCEFYKLCRAELTGLNAKFVLKDGYEEREDKYASEED